ncbi:MAG: 2-oxoacid:ferredoxin oxidoreductase subunit beta, partial [Candidatus Tectomicrobia bacterium]|nr:2-oxoacid:ferredoxin oxidoreductase subunit beta [Candidatus Tectomicrobia bacterium]
MGYRDFIREERFPTSWCGGCGIGIVLKAVCQTFEELGFTYQDTTVVSGIGCSARSAGYFKLDTIHSIHGRAVPVAEGIKLANEKLHTIVFSGDGDLLGIGGNHLLHACRRNTDITVICIDNEIYGMTGGQKSPTTELNIKTLTSPKGNQDRPINVQAVIRAHENFYARSTVYHYAHMRKCLKEAFQWPGLAFVDVKAPCISNNGRRLGFKNGYEMLIHYKDEYKIRT